MPYTAQQIADYIISDAHESGSFISNLKLQKLLYYFYCIPHIRSWFFRRGNTLRERCAYSLACSLRRSQRVLRRQSAEG